MRKLYSFFVFALIGFVAAVSCNKESDAPQSAEPLKLIIRAGAPTKTAIAFDGDKSYTPSWSANDAIGVYFTSVSDNATEFVNADAGATAFFEPSSAITGVSGDQTLYAFYPFGAFHSTTSGTNIRVNVKDTQSPDVLGSFDKTTDILVARPYAGNISTINEDGGIIDLAFARLLSVVKVTPTDATSGNILAGEYVKSVKIEYNGSGSDAPLTGRVTLDLNSGEFSEWTIKEYSVSAAYGDDVFALNGTNAAYLLVNPVSIASGKKVTFTVKTNKHDISKEVTLGAKGLTFPAGNIAKIGLSIDDSWTIADNTLDPNIIFKTPFYADISGNTSYNSATHGDLGVVGTSKSSITYTFEGSSQLRNNNNKISADDGSFYWCTSSTGLVIGGINTGTAQYFTLSFDRKVPSNSATLALSISQDGTHFFPITSSETVSFTGTDAATASYNFSIPAGEHTGLSLKFANSGSGATIDNVTLTKLTAAGEDNKAVSFTVVAVDPTLEVSPSPVNLLEGATQQLTVTGTNGAITYTSNNTSVATVSNTGLVTAVAEGTTTISINSAATEEFNAGSTSVTVNVSSELSFETVVITENWSADLKNTTGNNAKFVDDGKGIWTVDSNYGHKAANNATAASFYSPKFDMSGVSAGSITFAHTGNLTGADYQSLGKAYYTLDDGASWTQISLTNPTSNYSWQTATIASSVYAGETIQFRWDFQGNSSKTWEVKDFVITVPVYRSITINQPAEGGTIAATENSSQISTGALVEVGKTIVLTASPASGYEFSEWEVTGATLSDASINPASITVGDNNITITASFTPESTANSYEYVFTSKSWGATRGGDNENWTSGKDGGQLTSGRGIQVTTAATGANGTSPFSFTDVEEVIVTYSTNASSGAGSIAVKVGDGTAKSSSVTSSGGTTDRELKFKYTTKESGKVNVTVNCTTNSVYIKSVTVKAADIVLPTPYDVTCASVTNGSIESNKASAYEGDTVTLTATPATGYKLDSWSVYKTGDTSTTVTVTNNTFTMPGYAVTVSASFTSNGGSSATAEFTPDDFTGKGTANTGGEMSVTKSGITVADTKGYGTSEIRCYANGTLTISAESGKTITAISFTFSGEKNGGLNSSYTDLNTNSWSVTHTTQARFTKIEVTYSY